MSKGIRAMTPLRPMPDDEALQWLVAFAQQDLDRTESPGAWVDIGWNLARLFNEVEWSAPEDRMQIKNVQAAIRSVLENLSREGGTYHEGTSIGTRSAERKGGKLHVGYDSGHLEANIVDILLGLLARTNLDRLGRCKRCETIFLGTQGQLYCGKQCANAAAAEAYRKRKRNTINEKARTEYEKQQRKRIGPKVKVGHKRKEV